MPDIKGNIIDKASGVSHSLLKFINKRRLIFGICVALIAVIGITLVSICISKSNKQQHQSAPPVSSEMLAKNYITKHLQNISGQLVALERHLDRKDLDNRTVIKHKLAELASQTRQLSARSEKTIEQQVSSATLPLRKQLTKINEQLFYLQKQQKHIKYLAVHALPFKVVSIDNIQQNNVVTINYNHTVFALEVDSYLAGWKLIEADFASQKCQFVNGKQQHVAVDLNRAMVASGDKS